LRKPHFANGLGGERLEKVVGDLIVDVGTDQPSTPLADNHRIRLRFIAKQDARACQSRNKRRIDIGHDGKSVVNCDLVVETPITFLILHPNPVIHTYGERFSQNLGQQRLAIATFPLTILN